MEGGKTGNVLFVYRCASGNEVLDGADGIQGHCAEDGGEALRSKNDERDIGDFESSLSASDVRSCSGLYVLQK
jgi:hypothetical protein